MRAINRKFISAIAFAAAIAFSPQAIAQGVSANQNDIYFNPELTSTLLTPSHFEGYYAGIQAGLMNNNFNTFYDSGANTYRIPVGVFAGYNHQIQPGLLVGAEVQADISVDWTNGALGYNLFTLGKIGVLVADQFAVYHLAGLGLINNRSAYALGVSVEQAITQNLSARAQILAYGQLAAPSGVTNYGGFTMMKIDVGAVWHFDDNSSDPFEFIVPSAGALEVTDFTGPYLGLYAGVAVNSPFNFFVGNATNGWHMTRFVQGGIAGYNYALNDWARVGIEAQGGWSFNTSGTGGWDGEILARAGVVPIEGLMIYGSAGVGIVQGRDAFAVGGGVEYALWGKNTVRVDAQLWGEITPSGPIVQSGTSATKVTIGTLWHLD